MSSLNHFLVQWSIRFIKSALEYKSIWHYILMWFQEISFRFIRITPTELYNSGLSKSQSTTVSALTTLSTNCSWKTSKIFTYEPDFPLAWLASESVLRLIWFVTQLSIPPFLSWTVQSYRRLSTNKLSRVVVFGCFLTLITFRNVVFLFHLELSCKSALLLTSTTTTTWVASVLTLTTKIWNLPRVINKPMVTRHCSRLPFTN